MCISDWFNDEVVSESLMWTDDSMNNDECDWDQQNEKQRLNWLRMNPSPDRLLYFSVCADLIIFITYYKTEVRRTQTAGKQVDEWWFASVTEALRRLTSRVPTSCLKSWKYLNLTLKFKSWKTLENSHIYEKVLEILKGSIYGISVHICFR